MKRVFEFLPVNLLALALVCCACLVGQAQNREKFVISAKAGGVNSVSGDVKMQRQGAKDWQSLTDNDDLNSGDVVRTGMGGLVEVLLNPGTYLRLPENSEFELTDAALDALRVRLLKGSAILEATGADGSEMLISIDTPQTKLAIVRKGVYRINVTPSGQTEVLVRNGRALVGAEELKVKGGKKVIVGGSSVPAEVAKLDKKNQDQFDVWSKERAEALAKANRKVSDRMLNTLFSGYTNRDWDNLSSMGQLGIWFFNPGLRAYTFLPFYQGWGSPYGHSYMSSITNIYFYPELNPYYPYRHGNNGQPQRVNPVPNNSGVGRTGGGDGPVRSNPNPAGGREFPNRTLRGGRPRDIDDLGRERVRGRGLGGDRPDIFERQERSRPMSAPSGPAQSEPRSERAPMSRPAGGGRGRNIEP